MYDPYLPMEVVSCEWWAYYIHKVRLLHKSRSNETITYLSFRGEARWNMRGVFQCRGNDGGAAQ